MSFLKRMLGSLGGHHGGYRTSHHGQTSPQGNYSNPEPKGLSCPRCKVSLAPGARFCGQCGSGLEHTLCTCGATIAAGAKFCGQCGSSL